MHTVLEVLPTQIYHLCLPYRSCYRLAPATTPLQPNEVAAIKTMLRSKAGKIAGGSWEVQLNIIAERLLGLPRDP